jgi:hypothetical protein
MSITVTQMAKPNEYEIRCAEAQPGGHHVLLDMRTGWAASWVH